MVGLATERQQRRRRVGVGVGLVALIAALVSAFAVVDRSPDTVASLDSSSVTTTAPTTTVPPPSSTTADATTATMPPTSATTTTTTATTTLAVQRTRPVAPPQDAYAAEPRIELGRIVIPEIGLDAPLLEGIRLSTLDQAPGHWPGSAMPGEVGNVVVAAHRTSHNAEFRYIDELDPGDEVVFATPTGDWTYRVTGTHVVYPDALWITDPTPTPTATLFACHPLGSTAQRIVVDLELAS